jgi:hypothetical protein
VVQYPRSSKKGLGRVPAFVVLLGALLSGVVCAEETKLELVYFGFSGCGFCRNPELRSKLGPAIEALRKEARSRGWSFEAIAVSVDENLEHGRAFLKTYCSEFDTHFCTGEGFKTALFQDLILKRPAHLEGVAGAQVEGIPYLVLTKDTGERVVLARFLSGTMVSFLDWVAEKDPVKRPKMFACVLDQSDCPRGG